MTELLAGTGAVVATYTVGGGPQKLAFDGTGILGSESGLGY